MLSDIRPGLMCTEPGGWCARNSVTPVTRGGFNSFKRAGQAETSVVFNTFQYLRQWMRPRFQRNPNDLTKTCPAVDDLNLKVDRMTPKSRISMPYLDIFIDGKG